VPRREENDLGVDKRQSWGWVAANYPTLPANLFGLGFQRLRPKLLLNMDKRFPISTQSHYHSNYRDLSLGPKISPLGNLVKIHLNIPVSIATRDLRLWVAESGPDAFPHVIAESHSFQDKRIVVLWTRTSSCDSYLFLTPDKLRANERAATRPIRAYLDNQNSSFRNTSGPMSVPCRARVGGSDS